MANSMMMMKYNTEELKISPYFQQKAQCGVHYNYEERITKIVGFPLVTH